MSRESAERWLNPGGMLRDWFHARDVRRWERCGRFPPTLERTYWSPYEYQSDLARLQARGYCVSQERSNKSSPAARIDVTPSYVYRTGAFRLGTMLRRAPVMYRVSYERLSYSTWAATVNAAARRARG